MKSVEDIINAAHQHGFGHLAAEVAQSARRTLLLRPSKDVAPAVGTSKFGGCPDLPDGIVWPESGPENEELGTSYPQYQYEPGPMRFIAQINLSELPFVPDGLKLPSSGLIYFFAAVQKIDFPLTGCFGEDWHVFSSSDHEKLVRASPPIPSLKFIEASRFADLGVDENTGIVLPEHRMEFHEDWIPDHKILYGCGLGAGPYTAYFRGCPQHRLGGYPNHIQSPVDAADFSMLAQFDTDHSIGLIWAFGGRAFFMGNSMEIELGNFHKIILITQCS
ncbi:MAG: hypothetical protein JWM59_2979 [Verrucomicrobiales bacterium]|nr:hypothetical protein [Verrucomicrobiales bacterium]